MTSTFVRRALRTALLGGVVAGSLLSHTVAASANTPATVAAGGSDTTQDFMASYMASQSGQTVSSSGVSYDVTTFNIPAVPTAAGYNVPDDGNCTATTPANAQFPGGTMNWQASPGTPTAPNGSGAGRTRLALEKTNSRACLDFSRSSSKGTESGYEYYGFALDAVSWASPSAKAPRVLSRAQIQSIWNCTVTDWKDVGGVPGPIQRYLPQSSSGTRNTFLAEYLDITNNATPTQTSPSCPPVKVTDKFGNAFEENQGLTIADADIDKAILPFSAGQWVYQKNNSINPTIDKRNNIQVGANQTAPATGTPLVATVLRWNTGGKYELDYTNSTNPNAVVDDSNTSLSNSSFSKASGFDGVRFLFNVVDSTNPLSKGPARALVGFDNAGTDKSPLCSNAARTTILSFGFAPLSTTGGGAANAVGATCRAFINP